MKITFRPHTVLSAHLHTFPSRSLKQIEDLWTNEWKLPLSGSKRDFCHKGEWLCGCGRPAVTMTSNGYDKRVTINFPSEKEFFFGVPMDCIESIKKLVLSQLADINPALEIE